jgi:hypothetical protein
LTGEDRLDDGVIDRLGSDFEPSLGKHARDAGRSATAS